MNWQIFQNCVVCNGIDLHSLSALESGPLPTALGLAGRTILWQTKTDSLLSWQHLTFLCSRLSENIVPITSSEVPEHGWGFLAFFHDAAKSSRIWLNPQFVYHYEIINVYNDMSSISYKLSLMVVNQWGTLQILSSWPLSIWLVFFKIKKKYWTCYQWNTCSTLIPRVNSKFASLLMVVHSIRNIVITGYELWNCKQPNISNLVWHEQWASNVSISSNWTVAINRKGEYEPLRNGLYLF